MLRDINRPPRGRHLWEKGSTMTQSSPGDGHYVYLDRAEGSGTVMYVGYGMRPYRALADAEQRNHQEFAAWLDESPYSLEIAGPYNDEASAKEVEAALIEVVQPRFNRARGHGCKFRPVGVPHHLADRQTEDALTISEIGRRTGGALLVYLSPGDELPDGRKKFDAAEPDDRTVVSNIEERWQIGPHLDEWCANVDDGPRVLVGLHGPVLSRFIVGAARIDTSRWGDEGLRVEGNRWRVPLVEPVDLDAEELRGRRAESVKFGNLSHLLHIWVDGEGAIRHPRQTG